MPAVITADHVTLKRSTKGVYSWEVKAYGDDSVAVIEQMNTHMLKKYGEQND